jgi:hypothetical protein
MYKNLVIFGKFWSFLLAIQNLKKLFILELFIFLLQNFGYIQLLKKKDDHNQKVILSTKD